MHKRPAPNRHGPRIRACTVGRFTNLHNKHLKENYVICILIEIIELRLFRVVLFYIVILLQRWKPVGSTGLVELPLGSRFFDRPVKLVEKPVEFSFLATKRHLSTNRNILTYFIINKTFYKKSELTNHTFRKHLLNGFKL